MKTDKATGSSAAKRHGGATHEAAVICPALNLSGGGADLHVEGRIGRVVDQAGFIERIARQSFELILRQFHSRAAGRQELLRRQALKAVTGPGYGRCSRPQRKGRDIAVDDAQA